MSPLSEEEDDISSPPSPVRSQSSMSNSSSAIQISHSDSPVPSVDSPATGEGPSWESGVVRMYADGPKGLAAKGKEEKKYDELLPSDEADVSELFFLMCEYWGDWLWLHFNCYVSSTLSHRPQAAQPLFPSSYTTVNWGIGTCSHIIAYRFHYNSCFVNYWLLTDQTFEFLFLCDTL